MRISDWSSDVCSSDLWDWYDIIGASTRTERGSGAMLEKLTTGEYKLAYLSGAAGPWLAVRDPARAAIIGWRSEERRVGKECVSTCRSWWSPFHEKKKKCIHYCGSHNN